MTPLHSSSVECDRIISDIHHSLDIAKMGGCTVVREDEWLDLVGECLDMWCDATRMHQCAADAVHEMNRMHDEHGLDTGSGDAIRMKMEFISAPCFSIQTPRAEVLTVPIAELTEPDDAFKTVRARIDTYASYLKLVTKIFDMASMACFELRGKLHEKKGR